MNISRLIIFSAMFAGSVVGPMSGSATELLTEWKSFPSMDWRDQKNKFKATQLCPTERYVYAVVHGNIFTNSTLSTEAGSYRYNNNAYLNLFVYDTRNPNLGFRAASQVFDGSDGINVSSIGYNKDKNYLLVGYQDGRIELIRDDGTVVAISDFMDAKVPGSKFINSISFSTSTSEAFLATKNGYVVIDDEAGCYKEWVKLWGPVNYISRVGNKLVAVAPYYTSLSNGTEVEETTVLTYDLTTGTPTDIMDFKPIEITDKSSIPSVMINTKTNHLLISDGILPLTEKTFATVGRKGSTNANALSVITFTLQNDGSWKTLTVVDDLVTNHIANSVVFSPLISGINPSAAGYSIKGKDYHMITAGIDPDFSASNPQSDYKSKIYTKITHSATNELFPVGGSYDGIGFWTYLACGDTDINGGFRMYEKDSNGKLTLKKSKLIADGPYSMFNPSIEYSPGYGMVSGGREFGVYFGDDTMFSDYTAVYNNGHWEPFGMGVIQPSQQKLWIGHSGLVVDPDNPKYIYAGSWSNGIMRKNLEDPNDLLHIVFGGNYNAKNQYDVEIMPSYSANTGHTNANMMSPTFDSEGRLWTASSVQANFNSSKEKDLCLFFWEKDARLASTSKETYQPMKRLYIENTLNTKPLRPSLIALKHEKNKNMLVAYGAEYYGDIVVIDHRGTPEDPSDDRVATVTNLVDEKGRSFAWDYVYRLGEDPVEGRVWLMTGGGLFWIDTNTIFDKPNLVHRVEIKKVNGIADETTFCDGYYITSYTVDNQGRKWFGTHGNGLFCLSADNTEQLAHFDVSNSGLRSNTIFGLGWNPETNSLLISNGMGMQEMTVLDGVVDSEKSVKIYPVAVTPDYKGFVNISGVLDTDKLLILDEDDEEVKELATPVGGKVQWDLTDAKGRRCVAGTYTVVGKSSRKSVGKVVIM